MQSVILAAGLGTRLEPLTNTTSKVMLPVAGKPLLKRLVENLSFSEVIIVARKEQKDIIDNFPDAKIVFQDEPLGTGHAVLACKNLIKDKFLLINGDEVIPEKDMKKIASMSDWVIGCYRTDPRNYAAIETKGDFVTSIEEKPVDPKTNLANSGIYLLDKSVFPILERLKPSSRGEYEITEALRIFISEGGKLRYYELSDWITITYPWQLLDANKMMLDKTGSIIEKNVEIRQGAFIEEPVFIGEGSVIGPNCFIRKYSCIGRNCRVGNAVEIKNSIIMDNTYVSHLSYVGDSIVGRDSNIGAGCIFANLRLDDKTVRMKIKRELVDSQRRKLGAIIGDNVKLGVNVTIMPGKMIWNGLLIPACYEIKEDIREQIPLK